MINAQIFTYLLTLVIYTVLLLIAAVVVIGALWVIIRLSKKLFR